MKRFLFNTEVVSASGYQTFYVDAENVEQAKVALENGGGEFYSQDVEITGIGEFEFDYETSLDDFGDGGEGVTS